jgi:hypothetical protein
VVERNRRHGQKRRRRDRPRHGRLGGDDAHAQWRGGERWRWRGGEAADAPCHRIGEGVEGSAGEVGTHEHLGDGLATTGTLIRGRIPYLVLEDDLIPYLILKGKQYLI